MIVNGSKAPGRKQALEVDVDREIQVDEGEEQEISMIKKRLSFLPEAIIPVIA